MVESADVVGREIGDGMTLLSPIVYVLETTYGT